MKILALDQGEHIGGAERFFSELLTRLPEDFEIHLVTGNNEPYRKRYENSSVKIHQIELLPLKPIGFKSLRERKRAQKEIAQMIQELKPDLILSNTVRTHIVVSPLAKKFNIPLVWMAHDRTFPKTLLRWFGRYPQQVICCSQFVQSFYQKAMKNKSTEFSVLYPFGIDPKELEELNSVQKKPIIGMVGKFIPWKGQDIFIQAAQQIHQQFPDYRFTIIGSMYEDITESKKFFQHCQDLVTKLGLEDCFEIRDSQNAQREMAEWEVLVHCSREPEPLGRVVLEGMAAGCCVIASNLGGPKEVVKDGETGLVVSPEVSSLSSAITKVLKEHESMNKLMSKAKAKIGKQFNWSTVELAFQNILER